MLAGMTDPRAPLQRLRDSLADRFDTVEVDELFAAGEWHVGFEMLADQVYEADIALTAEELRLVDDAAACWTSPAYRRSAQFAAACLHASGPRGADGRWPVRILTVAHSAGAALRTTLCAALGLPGSDGAAWATLPVRASALPHVLELRDWDVLRAAHPADARGMLEWLVAAIASGAFTAVITDTNDAPVDPHAELRRA